MRPRQLEVFTAVMRAGTVTGAARLLNISQPALSQTLMHAEDELGFALFERVKGRLVPTPEAVELYPEAERLFAGLEGLRRKSADLRVGQAGLVRIAASPPLALSRLPRAMARFRAARPEVLVRVQTAPLSSLIEMLRAGDAALALALDDALPPDIAVEPLGQAGFCCLMPESHPLADLPTVPFSRLTGETVISYRRLTRPGDELAVAAMAEGTELDVQIEIDGSIAALGLVSAGLGVAVVDDLVPWQRVSGLVSRPLAVTVRLPISALRAKGKVLSRAETLMLEEVRAVSNP